MRPIKCDGEVDEFSRSACHRIVDNQIGEKELFSNGMSIIDLQVAYASSQPFVKYREWKTGFCLYSDWIWGFFTNFYNLSVHVEDDKWKDIPHARIEGYNQSEIYAGPHEPYHEGLRRICDNAKDRCNAFSSICHYQTPENMTRLAIEVH
jgi:hypothetical protein